MDVTEILLIIFLVLFITTVCINAYYFFYHKNRVSRFNHGKGKFASSLKFINGIGIAGLVAIAGYLFLAPAKVQQTSLPNGAVWMDYSKPFELVFDKPVNSSSTFTFSKEIKGEWKWEKKNSADIFKRKLVFYPLETLLPEEKITVTSEIKSFIPLAKSNYSSEFSSGTSTPKLEISDEITDKQNVNPNQGIQITVPDANPNSYILELEANPKIELTQNKAEGNKILVTHTVPFKNNESYEIAVYITPVTYNTKTSEIITRGTKKLERTLKFQIAPSPSVKEVSPKGTNALANEEIIVEFDQEMNKESVEKGLTFSPEIKGTFSWNEEGSRVALKPSETLKKETKYTITLSKDIESKFGAKYIQELPDTATPDKQKEFTFTTIGSVGVAKTTPGNNAQNIDINASYSITFTQAVDKASAESKITMNPKVAGKFSWNGNTVTFKPDSAYLYSAKYTVTIAAGIKSIDGLDFKNNYVFSFTTKPNKVVLAVPVISQTHQFSCNVTAASIALKFRGISVSQDTVYANIPKQSVPKENGFWGNPNLGYVGNIDGNSSTGYGVHWGPIANYISKYRPVSVKSGWNLTDLLKEIDAGNPVIIWWQNGYAAPTRMSWKSYDGSGNTVTINAVNGMHSEVVVGYVGSPENPTQIILSDPWNSRWGGGYHYTTASRFKSLWSYYNNTGIVVR